MELLIATLYEQASIEKVVKGGSGKRGANMKKKKQFLIKFFAPPPALYAYDYA